MTDREDGEQAQEDEQVDRDRRWAPTPAPSDDDPAGLLSARFSTSHRKLPVSLSVGIKGAGLGATRGLIPWAHIEDRLRRPRCAPVVKCALTISDIEAYGLPADFTKASDTRSAAFVAKWGDVSVELDALPIELLRERIVGDVERRMDLTALEIVRAAEGKERRLLVQALGAIGGRT